MYCFRGILTYSKNGTDFDTWKLNIYGETWIQPEDLDAFLANKYDSVAFMENKQDDGSDKWVLVERESKKGNMKPKRIYISPSTDDLVY